MQRLEALILMLEHIKTDIRCNAPLLSHLIEKLCQREEFSCLDFLNSCKAMLEQEHDFPHAWKTCVLSAWKQKNISMQEKDILLSFGQSLGISDIEGQISNCDTHIDLLNCALVKARDEKENKGKLCTTLGLLSGLGAAILFI